MACYINMHKGSRHAFFVKRVVYRLSRGIPSIAGNGRQRQTGRARSRQAGRQAERKASTGQYKHLSVSYLFVSLQPPRHRISVHPVPARPLLLFSFPYCGGEAIIAQTSLLWCVCAAAQGVLRSSGKEVVRHTYPPFRDTPATVAGNHHAAGSWSIQCRHKTSNSSTK